MRMRSALFAWMILPIKTWSGAVTVIYNVSEPSTEHVSGCGKSVHTECLNHYAQHALSTGTPIKCPLCRHNWGQFEFTPPSTLQSRGGSRPVYTTNILCDHCHSTISSAIFNCLYCTSYHLCESCYTKNPMPHSHHSFLYKASPSSPWTEPPMAMLAAQLQNRELTPDDYDLLLQLDSDAQTVCISFHNSLSTIKRSYIRE